MESDMQPLILNGQFFEFIEEKPVGPSDSTSQIMVSGTCVLCAPKKVVINSTKNSTGNFHKHMRQRKHPNAVKKFELLKVKTKKRTAVEDSIGISSLKKANIVTPFERVQTRNKISTDTVNELVCNYLIQEMLPIYTVEKESFKQLISGLSGGSLPSCRKTIMNLVYKKREEITNLLMKALQSIPYLCTPADIWSSNNKSYLGVTCHYLDNSLARHSIVLACRRIKYSHTHLEIAKLLFDIHKQYNLSNTQIVATVTDNAANFGKAFRVYSVPESISNPEEMDFLSGEHTCITIHDIPDFNELMLQNVFRSSGRRL